MKNYLVRVYIPRYYDVKADTAKDAERKAEAIFHKENPTGRVPTVEIILDEGIGVGFWDSVDAAIDDYKERGL